MSTEELARFAIALVLAPSIVVLGMRLHLRRAALPFALAYAAMLLAFGTSLYAGPELLWLRILRHLLYAAGGTGLAVAASRLRRLVLEHGEEVT